VTEEEITAALSVALGCLLFAAFCVGVRWGWLRGLEMFS
jgi:hypothetical protein